VRSRSSVNTSTTLGLALGGAGVLGRGGAVVVAGSADDGTGVSDREPVPLLESIRPTARAPPSLVVGVAAGLRNTG